jgi:hypothetical protein
MFFNSGFFAIFLPVFFYFILVCVLIKIKHSKCYFNTCELLLLLLLGLAFLILAGFLAFLDYIPESKSRKQKKKKASGNFGSG